MGGYRFGEFQLDCGRRQLLRRDAPVHLSPKAFQLLQALVETSPRVISKSDLQDRLWPGVFVVEANLQHLIGEVRRALGDDAHGPGHIRTAHRVGYAFQRCVERVAEADHGRIRCRLQWHDGRTTLAPGVHVIGREASADVVLDSSTVSRQHARICVAAESVTLEDLGSKNGSYVHDRPVRGPVALADGDDIRIGMVPVRVRISTTRAESTETAILEISGDR